jgi:hypothetical protein
MPIREKLCVEGNHLCFAMQSYEHQEIILQMD